MSRDLKPLKRVLSVLSQCSWTRLRLDQARPGLHPIDRVILRQALPKAIRVRALTPLVSDHESHSFESRLTVKVSLYDCR